MKLWRYVHIGVLLAGPAHAHGALPGGGGFYAGLSHPFLAWEHLLLILALGLLLGSHIRPTRKNALVAFATGLIAGGWLGTETLDWHYATAFVLALGVVSGSLVAAALNIPSSGLTALAAACGIAIGLDTGVPAPTSTSFIAIYAPYAGVVVGAFLILLNAMALAALAVRPPYTIGLRVVGAWVVAASLMVLALTLRRVAGA